MKFVWLLPGLLLIATPGLAFVGDTHQYICNQAGYSNLDCAEADITMTPAPYFHLCLNNATDCEARAKAAEYQTTRPEIAAHLWGDSMCPVHWKLTSYDCHNQFETRIDEAVKSGQASWTVTQDCGPYGTFIFTSQDMGNTVSYVSTQMAVTKFGTPQFDLWSWLAGFFRNWRAG